MVDSGVAFPHNHAVERFLRRSRDRTYQERRAEILAFNSQPEATVSLLDDSTDVKLPNFLSDWVGVRTGMKALQANPSEFCQHRHLEAEVRILAHELIYIGFGDGRLRLAGHV